MTAFARHWGLRIVVVIALAVTSLGDARVFARESRAGATYARLDLRLREALDARRTEPQRVIIRVRGGQRSAMRQALQAHGDQVVAEHASLDALTAVVHGDDLAELASRDGVVSVSTDAIVQARGGLLGGLLGGVVGVVGGLVGGLVDTLGGVVGIVLDPAENTEGPAVPPQVLRETLGLGSTWTGRGVTVAVIDSGLEMSYDFQDRVLAFYDFTGGKTAPGYPFDDYGHGTHVAGAIGSSGANSYNREYRGLAPKAKFVILKVLDQQGAGYTSDVIRAVDFAVANRDRFGIDIINLSLGHTIYEPAATDPLVQAVERASRAGIIVVAAAGNLGKNPETGLPGYAGITSPGNAPSAITVGAVKTNDTVVRGDDRVPDYSSAGPTWYDAFLKPDILAPGHNIVANAAKRGTLYQNYPQLQAPDADYMKLSGTSMATAVTSGVVAQVLEAHRSAHPYDPALTPNVTKAVLQYTALNVRNDAGVEYDPLRQGRGALNGKGAIDLGRRLDTSRPQGSFWLTTTPEPFTTIGGEPHAWSQSVIWGADVISGNTIDVNQTAWASSVIWGANVVWGQSVIWGANVVWSDPQSWSTSVIWGANVIGASNGSSVIWGASGSTADTTAWGSLEDK
jgi:serine protease AprX